MLVTGASTNFTVGDTVSATGSDGSTSITATIAAWDTNTNILKLTSATGEFGTDVTITSSSGVTATIKKHDQATATATVGVVATTDGDYINQDGHISETTMRIQDSLVYQDYSYIIKVGRSINDWRDSYSSTLHTAGFYFQGEVNIESQLDLKLRNVTGLNTGVLEVIQGVVKTIFTTMFGRRLGTTDDGTTLRSNVPVGIDPDFVFSTTPPQLNASTRDLTLNRAYTLKFRTGGSKTIEGVECKRGFLYSGYSYRTINREAFRTFSDGIHIALEEGIGSGHLIEETDGDSMLYEDNDIKGLTIEELNKLKIIGTGSSLDGTTALMQMTQSDDTRSFKTSLAIPSHITVTPT